MIAQNALSGQTSLVYSTYVGGSAADAGQGIAVPAQNAVYITGTTTSWNFPWHDNLQPFNGAGDAFVAKFDPTSSGSSSFFYASPLGGTSMVSEPASATGNGIATDGAGHVYVAGFTTSADFPTAITTESPLNGFQQTCGSCQQLSPASDAFLVAITESSSPLPSVFFSVPNINFSGERTAPQFATLLNGGEAPLTISSIQITGANAADFSLSGQGPCLVQSIQPGLTPACSFEVSFTPSNVGPEVADISFTDNAPGSPHILELTGAGQGPLAQVSPAALNFGNQIEGITSQGQVIAVSNAGNTPLSLSFNASGPDVSQFFQSSVSGSCTSVPPLGSCSVQIMFKPTTTGTFHAEMYFTDNSGNVANTKQVVPLTGVGVTTAPIANISPGSLTFGNVTVGSSSSAQSVQLQNQGSAALSLTGISIIGSNAADFAFAPVGNTCPLASGTLAIGAQCSVAVQFAPLSSGATKNASLSFTDNAAGSPQQVALSGASTAAPTLQLSPTSLGFAPQGEGTISPPLDVTILNAGSVSAGISGVTVTGTNSGDFTAANSCAPSLAAGKNCQIGVSFNPSLSTPAGNRSAILNVPGATPPTVALTGPATQAAISVPASINFGSQLAGGSGISQPVTVSNTASGTFAGALSVTSVTKTGTNAGDFAITGDTCTGQNTPPSGTCAIQVAFNPLQSTSCGAGAARSALLTLADNAPGAPHSIALSGTAMDFCFGATPGQGVSEPVPAGQTETFSLQIASFNGLTATAALTCRGAPPLGACTISTTPATTPPVVQVTPTTPGQFQLVVTSTAAGAALPANRRRDKNPENRGPGNILWLAMLSLALFAWAIACAKSPQNLRRDHFARLAWSGDCCWLWPSAWPPAAEVVPRPIRRLERLQELTRSL